MSMLCDIWLKFIVLIAVFHLVISDSNTVPEIIRKKGYPCEIHHVTTIDGYILTLHRIPIKQDHSYNHFDHTNELVQRSVRRRRRPPVLMQHGLLSSSGSWTLDLPHDAPAFVLANAGYDVWLSNIRGNFYSKNHTHFSVNSKEFWQFSWHEMAQYDFPAFIDYILNKTRFNQLYYIGHSMGTTIYFAGMSLEPSYNQKIRGMFALGPVATVQHIRTPIRYLAYLRNKIIKVMELIGSYEILPKDSLEMKLIQLFCGLVKIDLEICNNLLFLIVGFDRREFNQTWLPMVEEELSSGTSIYTIAHFAQEYISGNFQFYDFGKVGNREKYGQDTPPLYDAKKVSSPVHLIWGLNDYLADGEDVKFLIENLPNVPYKKAVPFASFNHLDFLWAPDAKKLVYEPILKMMEQLNKATY